MAGLRYNKFVLRPGGFKIVGKSAKVAAIRRVDIPGVPLVEEVLLQQPLHFGGKCQAFGPGGGGTGLCRQLKKAGAKEQKNVAPHGNRIKKTEIYEKKPGRITLPALRPRERVKLAVYFNDGISSRVIT
jgi:hypothetical protein